MFSRTAESIAHASRSVSPALHMLDPEQRLRLAKSSQKVGKLLGEMPVIDIIPASPESASAPSMSLSMQTRPLNVTKKGKRKAPPAPVLRYKLPSTRPFGFGSDDSVDSSITPPRAIPCALNLASPMSTNLSPFPYGYMKTPLTPEYLSPLTPVSPLSPIKTPDIQEHRLQTLRRLARMSRAFRETIVEEFAMSSMGPQATSEVHNVKTYLDLYRMSMKVAARRSQMLAPPGRRRSRSVSELQRQSVADSASVYSTDTRASFLMPRSATSARFSRMSYVLALGSPPVSPNVPDSPSSSPAPTEDSPLQQQQSVAQAKAVILGADAQLMEAFRRRFGIRQGSFSADPRRISTHPTTPRSPFATAKSPRVPYWVRSAYRSREGSVRRKRAMSRLPPTPRTMRKERRQGWGGEWKRGKMGDVVEKLKELEIGDADPFAAAT
ncbi:hypothetical protein BV20DRAFT_970739 [Pilatotrama ljubarskyi]|nr:hypothetical protein BV20DRAFT_970739 [Pilatotrama ljubarskyi]